jgi:hypothetical protein
MKRIVISDESINSRGFWVKTDGIDLSAFLKNPIMLWNHNRDWNGTINAQLPIGYWKDLRIENGVLTGEPVFDEKDDFAVKIKQKYEDGILNACSIGFTAIEWSDAPEMLKPGQTVSTVMRCHLKEISICDIPSNANATVVLYDDDNKIINLSDLPNTAIGPKINYNMPKEIALKLGLDENASPQACIDAIQQKDDRIALLNDENKALKAKVKDFEKAETEARKQEVTKLLDDAVKTGRIDATAKPKFEKFFELDHEGTKAVLASLPERKQMETKPVGTGDGDLCKMSWDELDKADRLFELKTKYPEIYQQKFDEMFNKKH